MTVLGEHAEVGLVDDAELVGEFLGFHGQRVAAGVGQVELLHRLVVADGLHRLIVEPIGEVAARLDGQARVQRPQRAARQLVPGQARRGQQTVEMPVRAMQRAEQFGGLAAELAAGGHGRDNDPRRIEGLVRRAALQGVLQQRRRQHLGQVELARLGHRLEDSAHVLVGHLRVDGSQPRRLQLGPVARHHEFRHIRNSHSFIPGRRFYGPRTDDGTPCPVPVENHIRWSNGVLFEDQEAVP